MSTDTLGLRDRVGDAVKRPGNWLELLRFGLVGASGYVVNLIVFTLLVHAVDVDYRIAAFGAFLVAVANNFLWNRRWTFRGHTQRAHHQAVRFLAVSVAAFVFNLAILELLVAGLDVAEVPSQAIAIVLATPVSFVGNKLWTFGK